MNSQIIKEDIKEIASADISYEKFSGKTVLITGANGFLPSYFVRLFIYLNDNKLDEKVTILALVRNKEKALKKFSNFLQRKDLILVIQDVNKKINYEGDIDYIIHAASQASPKYYGIDPVGTILPNVIGTYNLLELAKTKSTKKFLYISSSEVYGKTAHEEKIVFAGHRAQWNR